MDDGAALKLALELLYVPWRVRLVRKQSLPQGMELLLRIAAGDPASETAAMQATNRPRDVVTQAATFFIEQILLSPDADSYRVLGASPTATNSELRRNMALLMRWQHPDIAHQGDQSIFAARIATAWNNLKSPDRRAAYDESAMNLGDRKLPGTASSANQEPRLRSGRSRRYSAFRELRTSSLPRLLAFLVGRPRH